MAKRPVRKLKIGPDGKIQLPPDVLEALEASPGGDLEIFVDTRRKQVRLERHVEDPWAEATKERKQKGFDDLISDQEKRDQEASDLFDAKLKEPPEKKRPEDDPDLWR